ncbi:two-component system, sensor histidine kinase [Agrilactobacillus composti DSM 18527 = JCM 14202]|uniref:histidine kinase n=1 Tax=Agrilactobacillus composti DSM 18527 = JCM 14202 TaxID=1423734 RepID=X0PHG0_9LACO|nr:HAMP domain-containing sensor histidine kinase [Agrilactobacillus composti]KRM35965.1 two-component system, sensor histidine kinase [Agrilactobacillus composti DSM 18527 = JCM 14202]GAF41549.1 two-component system histidine kinase [Agrilactobacillus composti DSM 18527 = JCM 14202]
MKLIYQQMLGFFVVIFTTILIVSATVFSYSRNLAFQQTWTQLEGYADNLKLDATQVNTQTGQVKDVQATFLKDLEFVLRNQDVNFTIYDSDNQRVYGSSFLAPESLNKTTWAGLQSGKRYRQETNQNAPEITGNSKPKGEARTFVIIPWFYNNQMIAAVMVSSKVAQVQANIDQIKRNLLIAVVISSIAALILSYFIARSYVSRINRLRTAAHQVAEGNFDVHLQSKDRDEIDELAVDFNKMIHSLKASDVEIQRQEDRRRQFMADAAHEMRTPLTTINGLLEGLAYDAIPEESKGQSIELMRNETKRLIRLVNENLDYEKIRTGQIPLHEREFDAIKALHNIVEQLTKKAATAGDRLVIHGPETLTTYADYDRFIQIMFNIVQNAIQFTDKGTIDITAKKDFESTMFIVKDSGIGMTAEQVRNIWERYYKADPSRKNTKYGESGLGLAIVHSLVEQHKGTIQVQSKPDVGTTFTITFPDKPKDADTADKKATGAAKQK